MHFLTTLLNSMPGAIRQGIIWGILAMGVYITYKILNTSDLTVDGSLCTGGAMCVILTLNGVPMWAALTCSVIAGAMAGLVTGLLHTKFGIPAILSGILTQLALYSVNLHIMGWGTDNFSRANLPISVDKYNLLLSSRYVRKYTLQNPILRTFVLIVLVIVLLNLFFSTEVGASLRATGANQNMAKAQGIDTDSAKVLGLAIANSMVAFSGALLAQYQGFSDINMGRGAIVIGLAAVIIGEVLFGRVLKTIWGSLVSCVLGSIIYYIVIRIVLRMGLSTDDLKLLSAVVVALFLAVPYWKARYAENHVRRS